MTSSSPPPSDSPGDLARMSECQLVEAVKQVDVQLVESILRRAELIRARGQLAQAQGQTEQAAHQWVAESNRQIADTVGELVSQSSAIGPADATELLKHIASVCRATVPEPGVAYLGPRHSYSHLATLKYFGEGAKTIPVSTIASVFEAVECGDLPMGVVPIENSTDGRIVDTLERFVHQRTPICGEVLLPIHHNLLSNQSLEEITEIHSKPQAISQCRNWIARYAPSARLVEASSTVAAAETAAAVKGVAAIASAQAGRQYNLEVIGKNIEDNPNNVTRFAVLGHHAPEPTGDDKTTLLFQLDHQPGALAEAMMVFKEAELNLTWIESFPAPQTPNEYVFFIEFAGHRDDAKSARAMAKLSQAAQQLFCVGSYPRGQ